MALASAQQDQNDASSLGFQPSQTERIHLQAVQKYNTASAQREQMGANLLGV
jgi:hypothetical protein